MAFEGAKSFLRDSKLAPLLSSDAQALQTLNSNATVGTALQVLAKAGVLSCPVLDEAGDYEACLSVSDLLKALEARLAAKDPNWVEKLDGMTADDLLAFGKEFCAQPVSKLEHAGDLWMLSTGDESSLMDAVLESFRVQDRFVHHRLYVCAPSAGRMVRSPSQKTTVINASQKGAAAPTANGLKVTHVVSQSDVVRLLYDNRSAFSAGLSQTVEQLELDAGAVLTVPASLPVLAAFGHMARDRKSSLGVTEGGKLVGNLSASDLRGLTPEDFPLLLQPAGEFAKRAAAKAGGAPAPLVTVKLSSTFEEVLAALTQHHLHRVYVVDAEGAPVSIITLTDVLRLITKP